MQDKAPLDRVSRVRALMAEQKLDFVWVRSTDSFLNEYVPEAESTRAWLTGFTGSLGEAIIGLDRAWVFVDGRYYIQADTEVDASVFQIMRVPLGMSLEAAVSQTLAQVASDKRIGYEADRLPVFYLDHQQRAVPNAQWVPVGVPSLVERVRGAVAITHAPLRTIDESKLDHTSAEKLAALQLDADGLYVQPLDEIAWLANLRGSDLAFQATFRAQACVINGRLLLGLSPEGLASFAPASRPMIDAVPLASFAQEMQQRVKGKRIAFDPKTTTAHALHLLQAAGCKVVAVPVSPIGPKKAKKGPKELKAMVAAFAKADKVVAQAAEWLCTEVSRRKVVSEADFAEKVEALFLASGAVGLSFKVISAAGRNGAVIHYSTPNKKRVIKQGELMLLDTGAYYAEGYATDLTRTFLVGPKNQRATAEQKRCYTLVLKSAIAGMRARIPVGTRGDQLDAITRAPLWAAGFNYNHGTGHGVGINVHEFPPRIATSGTAPLEEGMVFSIEPGVYIDKFGGVRIENLCTLERIKGLPGFLQVRPLTFSPLDARLIERKLLNEEERAWLARYSRGAA